MAQAPAGRAGRAGGESALIPIGEEAGGGRRLLLICNPEAGGGSAAAPVGAAIEALRLRGIEVEVRTTRAAGDARRIARRMAAGYDRIAACGGDGTVSEVAAGIWQSGAARPLVVVPCGTANDFATAVGAGSDPAEALRLSFEGRIAPLDLAFANEIPFVNATSVGAAAEISAAAGPEWKAALGPLAYLAAGLARVGSLRGFEATLRGPRGGFEGRLLYLAVANGQAVGGGTRIAPAARVDDGLLDITVLPAQPPASLLGALRALRTGADHPGLLRMRGTRFDLESADELALTRDGEAARASRIRFRIEPAALRLVVHGPAPARTDAPHSTERRQSREKSLTSAGSSARKPSSRRCRGVEQPGSSSGS